MNPTPQDFGIWILVAIALLPGAKTVWEWARGERPQKREVSFAENFATAEELARVESDLGSRINAVDSDVRSLKESIVRNGEERRVRIEARVDEGRKEAREQFDQLAAELHLLSKEVSGHVASLQTATETTNQQLVLLSQKLDRVIERAP